MIFQTDPYLIWLLLPFFSTLGLGFYIQSRPRKKTESGALALIMFAGAFWSLLDIIQLISPTYLWQLFWNNAAFLAVVTIPTAWFLLTVQLTGYFREILKKTKAVFFIVPGLSYLALLTNGFHKLFYLSSVVVTINGFGILRSISGPLFLFHTFYSYLLIILGVAFLGYALLTDIHNKYGARRYGLIIGAAAPLIGNIIYLRGLLPPGFPDPTPIAFTVTGITFAWAIFADRMLDVVSIAHESVVSNLITGIIVLDLDNKIMDINPAAVEILGLSPADIFDHSIGDVLNNEPETWSAIQGALSKPIADPQELFIKPGKTDRTYELRISGIQDKRGRFTGHIIQFTDISRQEHVEKSLATAKENFASILDTLKDYYFETDVQGYITNINRPFYEHLGFSCKEELIGKHFRHFSDRKSVREVFQNFSRVFQTRETLEFFRYTYHTRDGTAYIGETTLSPIIEGDVTIGARGVLRNITDRVLAEELLLEAKAEAESRAEELYSINRIAAISSRSLNLNSILDTLCIELTNIFPIRNAGIALLSANQDSLEVVAFHSVDSAETSALGIILPLAGNSASQEVIEKQRTVVIQNSQEDSRTKSAAEVFKLRGTKAIMIVPLLTRGSAIGTIGMPARDPNYVFDKNEIRLAETIASQIAAAIDNAQLYAKTETALDLVERDLEIGRQIQAGFFPETIPNIPGWEIATHFEAARQVSGDFYDFFQVGSSGMTALVIADVCDKGVGAALFMVLFRSLLRAFGQVDINQQNVEEQLKNIILNTNNYITNIHGNSNMFATLFFGILNPDDGTLYYVNGGHELPVILDKEGRIIQRLPPTGPAVGLFPDAAYRVKQHRLNPGDFLVGFTDGTIDAHNEKGDLFSEERLLNYLQVPWTSMFSMVFELKNELHNFAKGEPQFDDITLISLRRKLTPLYEKHALCRPANIEILGEIRDFVESAALQSKLNKDEVFAFKLAADEICTNIIQYGFDGRDDGVLSLFFEKEQEKVRLIIRDDGIYFPPEQASTPDLAASWEERKAGGLGIHLVKELMDHISYSRMEDKGNQLILEKNMQRE
jgi:phosphoserine phosphatase RsbU/P